MWGRVIKRNLWMLRYFFSIVYFNYRMLPFKQAVKLPIWLYKPKFGKLSGKILLEMPEYDIKPGIIRIGECIVNIYPNTGCMIDNRGVIIFKGKCTIGNNSYISVGETGILEFGKDFGSTSSLKLACYHSIRFGNHVLVGWDCLFMDTDFHALTRSNGQKSRGYGSIVIEDEVWLANGCKVFKRSKIPARCVVSSQTLISSVIDVPEKTVIGNPYIIEIRSKNSYP